MQILQAIDKLRKMIESQGCTILNAMYAERALQECKGEDMASVTNALHLFWDWYQHGTVPQNHIQKLENFTVLDILPEAQNPNSREQQVSKFPIVKL